MVKLNVITTRTGDDGTTGLGDGSRVRKDSARIEAIGAVDELNAALGLARCKASPQLGDCLARLQNDLFDLGADLCFPQRRAGQLRMTDGQVLWLEETQAGLNAGLAPLTSFVLPGGSEAAAYLHQARTLARRAERRCVAVAATEPLNPEALRYINRLSDLLFVLARVANNGQDVLWVPGASQQAS